MERNKFLLVGEIGFWWGNTEKEKLFYAPAQPIDMFIDSRGGSVTDGHSISGLLRNHAATYGVEVRTVGIGLVASIATSVLLSGTRVEMDEDCVMMIHNPSVEWMSGEADDLRKTADTLDVLKGQLVDMYVRKIEKSGKAKKNTRKDIEEMMDAETWLTAQQALDFGLIDAISTFSEEKEESAQMAIVMPMEEQTQRQSIVNKAQCYFSNKQSQPNMEITKEQKGLWAKFLALFGNNAAEATTEATTEPAAETIETPAQPVVKTLAEMTDEELAAELEARKTPKDKAVEELKAQLAEQERKIAALNTVHITNLNAGNKPQPVEKTAMQKDLDAFKATLQAETIEQLYK